VTYLSAVSFQAILVSAVRGWRDNSAETYSSLIKDNRRKLNNSAFLMLSSSLHHNAGNKQCKSGFQIVSKIRLLRRDTEDGIKEQCPS
jgi:hypothetical protein